VQAGLDFIRAVLLVDARDLVFELGARGG
jgi:hypothetical protein